MWKKKLAAERLEDRCRSLEHRCEDLERAHKGLALEWEELYDKVRHQMSRMSRRAKAEPVEPLNDVEAEIPAGDMPTTDPISARILRRRNAGGFQR